MLCFSVSRPAVTAQPRSRLITRLCVLQVDSRDSLENVESKWVSEIADNCPGVKLVLVALKCDLREEEERAAFDDPESANASSRFIDYRTGLEVAQRIKALRYLGESGSFGASAVGGRWRARADECQTECSAKMNRGVNEAFSEAARVALTANAKGTKKESSCVVS